MVTRWRAKSENFTCPNIDTPGENSDIVTCLGTAIVILYQRTFVIPRYRRDITASKAIRDDVTKPIDTHLYRCQAVLSSVTVPCSTRVGHDDADFKVLSRCFSLTRRIIRVAWTYLYVVLNVCAGRSLDALLVWAAAFCLSHVCTVRIKKAAGSDIVDSFCLSAFVATIMTFCNADHSVQVFLFFFLFLL